MTVIKKAWHEITQGAFAQLAIHWIDDTGEQHTIFLEDGEAIVTHDEITRIDTDQARSARLSEIISEKAY